MFQKYCFFFLFWVIRLLEPSRLTTNSLTIYPWLNVSNLFHLSILLHLSWFHPPILILVFPKVFFPLDFVPEPILIESSGSLTDFLKSTLIYLLYFIHPIPSSYYHMFSFLLMCNPIFFQRAILSHLGIHPSELQHLLMSIKG